MMYDLWREEDSFGAKPVTKDLARHLYTRMMCGRIVIVAARPVSLLAALRRQWLKLSRKVLRESASTLSAVHIFEFKEAMVYMRTLRFSARWSPGEYVADVYIATADELLQHFPGCATLYITCKLDQKYLEALASRMPKGALVVFCHLA